MSKTITALVGVFLAVSTFGAILPPPTNAPPRVQLAWDASPSQGVTAYYVYYGVSPRTYTNKINAGVSLSLTITNLARGSTYYFAATAEAGGLESDWSNEVFWTPNAPPLPPTMKPVVVLTVEHKPNQLSPWKDAGMEWSLAPSEQTDLFRLRISEVADSQTPGTQKAVHVIKPELPPTPGK